MNKCKVVTKAGVTQLIIKSQKGQQVNDREVYAINNNEVNGLLHLDVIKKGSGFRLIYNLTGFIPFKEFLLNPLTKESFSRLLQNIVDIMKKMQAAYFSIEMLLMDFEHVMVNPATQSIYFAYLPIQRMEPQTSFRDFLLAIIQYAVFSQTEDNSYIREYIAILNNGMSFSLFELEQYTLRLAGKKKDASQSQERTCPKCHSVLSKSAIYCADCGFKVAGLTGTTKYNVYDPLEDEDSAEKPDDETNTAPPLDKLVSNEDVGGTTVLGKASGGTIVLNQNIENKSQAYLVRQSNMKKIMIDKDVFRIGHDLPDITCSIDDNGAVSRKHADILIKNEHFYIMDLNSTNGTFVDDKRIEAQTEVELYSGTRVRLADEEFMFYIE